MTQDELTALGRVWQERLRLQDWDITVRFARVTEFEHKSTMGDCDTFPDKRSALIRIQDPQDWHEAPSHLASCPWDLELTLVHELLHVHFRKSQPRVGGRRWSDHEAAIHRVSEALVRAYRESAGARGN